MEIPIRRYSTWIVHFSIYRSTTSLTSSSSRFSRMTGTWVHSFFSCYAGRDIGLLSSHLRRMALGWQVFKIFKIFKIPKNFKIFKNDRVHSFFSCYADQDIGLLSFSVTRLALDWQGHGSILRCWLIGSKNTVLGWSFFTFHIFYFYTKASTGEESPPSCVWYMVKN